MKDVELRVQAPPASIHMQNFYNRNSLPALDRIRGGLVWEISSSLGIDEELREATEAISSKASALGELASVPYGEVDSTQGGYFRRFKDCHIYYSAKTGAHEVHGEIRKKYHAVNGPAWLGLPVTDETACLDGRGRFNHFFKGSSIYWNPSTGPFYLRVSFRLKWESLGRENGELGYSVQDEESLSGCAPDGRSEIAVSKFQNGILCSKGNECLPALAATVDLGNILGALRSLLERKMLVTDIAIGPILATIRPEIHGIELVRVDDWKYGFFEAGPRTLHLKVRGFVGLPFTSDTTFEIGLGIQFSIVWPLQSSVKPTFKKVIATLVEGRIKVSGVFGGEIANLISKNLSETFTPGPGNPEVPANSMVLAGVPSGINQRGEGNPDFLDVMLMANGSLNIYVYPFPLLVGRYRKAHAQNAIERTLANL
jgi:hypothetical protein